MRTLIVLITSSVLFAQGNRSAERSENQSLGPDVASIVRQSIVATDRSWGTRVQYTYQERAEDRRLDSQGLVKSDDVEVSMVIFINGAPFDQLVEHNGKPPSSAEQRKQKDKINKLKRETIQDQAARLRQEEQDNTSLIHELPLAFKFELVGNEVISGRPAYVLQATPRPGYHPHGKYGEMFARVEGKLWVDKADFGWIKADGQVIQPFSIGFVLARILPGSRITMEQVRIGDAIWMPQHIEIQAAAKLFFLKSLTIDNVLSYSGYRPAQTGITGNMNLPR
jgi:hypothetical protein